MLITAVDAPNNMASATHRKHPQKSLAVLLKIWLLAFRVTARLSAGRRIIEKFPSLSTRSKRFVPSVPTLRLLVSAEAAVKGGEL